MNKTMEQQDRARGYGPAAKALHWLGALCVVLAWLLGTLGDDFPKAMEADALFVHMSLGLAVIGLLVIRLGWRLGHAPPAPLETALGAWSGHLATATHWLLYALMIAVPVAGITLEFARGQPVPVFGLFDIVSPWVRDRAFASSVKEVHELLANVVLAIASFHAVAALGHHYVLRDATLVRMLPGRRRI